ncbi:MAG TPA: lipoate--protein ligase family protein [Gemmatimonadota bacterium]|nr:lipoate--protein ligase family protein [Gemmatimonadota bacterium]
MTRWRLLETGARPGAWNMACDAALLASVDGGAAPPTIRFYGWDPPAVSLGHHQPEPEPAELARLRARGIEWVRRPTGGRAVYHGPPDEELTYSLVAALDDPAFGDGIAGRHRRIHGAIAAALLRLGTRVDLASRKSEMVRPSSRLACFAASVPGEIAVDGRKLVGSAQRRTRRAFLQHGSIPLAGEQTVLAEIWPGCLDPARTTSVSSAVGRSVGFDELARSLAAAFEDSLSVELVAGALTPEEEQRIDACASRPALA